MKKIVLVLLAAILLAANASAYSIDIYSFEDINANGKKDAGENYTGGFSYLVLGRDINKTINTSNSGKTSISTSREGTYAVIAKNREGWEPTTKTTAKAEAGDSIFFGNKKTGNLESIGGICSTATVSDVISAITEWSNNKKTISYVINLISCWSNSNSGKEEISEGTTTTTTSSTTTTTQQSSFSAPSTTTTTATTNPDGEETTTTTNTEQGEEDTTTTTSTTNTSTTSTTQEIIKAAEFADNNIATILLILPAFAYLYARKK